MFYVILLAILLVAFIVRWLPRHLLKHAYTSDTLFHLFYAKEIRKNKFKYPKKLNKFCNDHLNGYPPGYHYILALFNEKHRAIVERVTGAFLDSIYFILITGFMIGFKDHLGLSQLNIICISFLFAFAPIFLRLGWGPRAYNGSPRVLGQLLYMVHALGIVAFAITDNYWYIMATIISGSLLWISSIFGAQLMVFFCALGITFMGPIYVVVLIAGYALAVVLTFGKILLVTKSVVRHSESYYKFLMKRFLYPVFKGPKLYFKTVYWNLYPLIKERKVKEFRNWFLKENHGIHLLFTVFIILPLTVFLYFVTKIYIPSFELHMYSFFALWVLCGFFLFVLTKNKPFLFLGAGERYLEYSYFPLLLLFVHICTKLGLDYLPFVFFVPAIIGAYTYPRKFIAQHRDMNDDYANEKKIYDYLNNHSEEMVLPINIEAGNRVLNFTDKKLLKPYLLYNKDFFTNKDFDYWFGNGNLEFYAIPFRTLINDYQVNFVFVDKLKLKVYLSKSEETKNDFEQTSKLVVESKFYALYKVYRSEE